jgi:glycosyltransferase involved in cell wall biosynthesis
MKISVIIPSFNQGEFIEETIQSVLAQTVPEVEILVFDGGSTDGTIDVLCKYESRLAHWESAADRGQTHAINKGLARMSGDVWMYLNSDDLVTPGAFSEVLRAFSDQSLMWLGGACANFDDQGERGGVVPRPVESAKDYLSPWNRRAYAFPFSGASFMRREIFAKIGYFDESYHYSMDMEYYCRALFIGKFRMAILDQCLARWRWHAMSKTLNKGSAYGFLSDEIRIAARYGKYLIGREREELEKEVKGQRRWCAVREAMWLLNDGKREHALRVMVESARADWSILLFRPWIGALRRLVLRW